MTAQTDEALVLMEQALVSRYSLELALAGFLSASRGRTFDKQRRVIKPYVDWCLQSDGLGHLGHDLTSVPVASRPTAPGWRLRLWTRLGRSQRGSTVSWSQPLDRTVDTGESAIVIEHSLDVIARADWVIDLGPGAGHDGGRVVYQGPPAGLPADGSSLTGRHLHRRTRSTPEARRTGSTGEPFARTSSSTWVPGPSGRDERQSTGPLDRPAAGAFRSTRTARGRTHRQDAKVSDPRTAQTSARTFSG